MQEDIEKSIFTEIPTEKIYKDRAISVGAFLGGPLVAGYLIAENFKAFNEDERAKKTWIITIASTIVIFGGILLIPDNSKIPNALFPFLYSVAARSIAKLYQGHKINKHIENGGEFYNWWRLIAIGIIGTISTIGLLIFPALLMK